MVKNFDYLIVGAGTAGCVLANRLSADPSISVGLIEAGGSNADLRITMPMGCGKAIHLPRFSWQMNGVPETHANNRRFYHPRGNLLGGSSSINGMIYIRGQHQDFDDWAAAGAEGWGWKDVLPYFKKCEDQVRGADDWHAVGGPLHVSDIDEHHPVEDRLIAAAAAVGIPENNDFNGASQAGVGRYQATIKNGKRVSAANAYLAPVTKRNNLTVLQHTRVLKIDFAGQRAKSLLVRQGDKEHSLTATREIILAAGAFQSPQLLKLSGVGPAAELRDHGIEVIAARSQVGENLHDHIGAPMAWKMKTTHASLNHRLTMPKLLLEVLRYLLRKDGIMAMPASSVGIFADSHQRGGRPDLQFHCLPLTGDLRAEMEQGKTVLSDYPGLTMMPYQARPKSRGTLRLATSNPLDLPAIHMNYFADQEDMNTLVRGMHLAQKIAATAPLAEWIECRVDPGPKESSDEAFADFARTFGHTGYHPVGTCRMGSDSESVVDCDLKVRGVSGLRVIDASVMPVVVSGNTNAATAMIAEKAADGILADRTLAA